MSDIFIGYARRDRETIQKLAAAIEAAGYSVWWDRNIVGGAEFSQDIERELDAARDANATLGERLARLKQELGDVNRQIAALPVPVPATGPASSS